MPWRFIDKHFGEVGTAIDNAVGGFMDGVSNMYNGIPSQTSKIGNYGFDSNTVPPYMIGNPSMGTTNMTTVPQPNMLTNAVQTFKDTPWLDTFDPTTGMKQQGMLMPMAQAIGTGANIYMGMRGLNQAQEQMNFQKSAWQEQFNLQKSEFDYARKRRQERQASYDKMKSRM